MARSYTILTASEIDADKLAALLSRIGGTSESAAMVAGRVSRGPCHVWIYQSPEILTDIDPPIDAMITEKLGGPPKGSLELRLSRAPGTDRLAIEVAVAMAEAWRAILWDDETIMFDLSDLRRMLKEGKDLPGG
jgi:hypothetical protein